MVRCRLQEPICPRPDIVGSSPTPTASLCCILAFEAGPRKRPGPRCIQTRPICGLFFVPGSPGSGRLWVSVICGRAALDGRWNPVMPPARLKPAGQSHSRPGGSAFAGTGNGPACGCPDHAERGWGGGGGGEVPLQAPRRRDAPDPPLGSAVRGAARPPAGRAGGPDGGGRGGAYSDCGLSASRPRGLNSSTTIMIPPSMR